MAKEFVCENCGYRGDHYKYNLFDALFPFGFFRTMFMCRAFGVTRVISGEKVYRACPQCNQRTIMIEVGDTVVIPGNIGIKKRWTTGSLIILILSVIFVLIILPILFIRFSG